MVIGRNALAESMIHFFGRLMPADLTFMMGKYPAPLPGTLLYARNHMWCREVNRVWHFGFTSYAVRLMQDVYFLDWCVDDGAVVAAKQQIGNIETSKAVSDLFAPLAGTIAAFNRDLLKDPSAINVDNHGRGWLFAMSETVGTLMDVQEYYQFITTGWENTQRILKGQINMEE